MQQLLHAVLDIGREHGLSGLLVIVAILLLLQRPPSPLPRLWERASDLIRGANRAAVVRRIDATINSCLYAIMIRHNSCRSYVFEYHAEKDGHVTRKYASCTYEVCNPSRDVSYEKDNLQQIPLSSIPMWVKTLETDREMAIYDVSEIRETQPTAYKMLTDQNITSVYVVGLFDFRGNTIGFCGIDYCCGRESQIKTDKDMDKLRLESVKIAGLLVTKNNGTLEQIAGVL